MVSKKKGKRSYLRDFFITGLLAMLPLVVTIYVIKLLYGMITSNLMPWFRRLAGSHIGEIPDSMLGILTVLLFVLATLLIGMLTKMYVGRLFLSFVDKTILAIPLVRSVYNAIKQMIDSFRSSSNNFEKVVLVEFPREGVYCVGFVVRDTQELITELLNNVKCYNVFVPTAPNPTSGFVTVMPADNCIELPITVDDGVKFIFSVGMLKFPSKEEALRIMKKKAEDD